MTSSSLCKFKGKDSMKPFLVLVPLVMMTLRVQEVKAFVVTSNNNKKNNIHLSSVLSSLSSPSASSSSSTLVIPRKRSKKNNSVRPFDRSSLRMDYISSTDEMDSIINSSGNDDCSSIYSDDLLQKFGYDSMITILETMDDEDETETTTSSNNNHFNRKLQSSFGRHGMPWKSSIDDSYKDPSLFYMPFWEWQRDFMMNHLTNLQPLPVLTKDGRDLSYIDNVVDDEPKPKQMVRMNTMQFTSDEYRKIRMTMYDAGNTAQVFTSLWYPQPPPPSASDDDVPSTPLPVLGIELLQFNSNMYLCVIDFQPLTNHVDDEDHVHIPKIQKYLDQLESIRDQYPSLQETMTNRYFDEQFFSKHYLLGRFDAKKDNKNNHMFNPQKLHAHELIHETELMPAFQQYVELHVDMVKDIMNNHNSNEANSNKNHKNRDYTFQQQTEYDNNAAKCDPAHAMFAKRFGKEFADDYVHDILFSLSTNKPK